jgi:hypothetical protein
MPEILRVRGFRFFFFSREGQEPRHIHVEQAERYAKFWLEPIKLVESRGFRGSELRENCTQSLRNTATSLSLPGMSTLASKPVADAVDVACTDDELIVTLVDGRRVSAPLAWFPRLLRATPKQRSNWRLIGRGIGIHWDDVDEDISVRTLLAS